MVILVEGNYRREFVNFMFGRRLKIKNSSHLEKLRQDFFRTNQQRKAVIFDNIVRSYSDEIGFKKALKNVARENLFLSLTDLDAVPHRWGVGSREYINKIQQLNKSIEILVNDFLKIHREADIVILSDHGFVNIVNYIEADFRRIGGLVD